MARDRLDRVLVERGLAASRTQAQKLIDAGAVRLKIGANWRTISRAAEKIDNFAQLQVDAIDELKYVSRGGLKLELALAELMVRGALADSQHLLAAQTVLDVGQSTGGFTDCALRQGARRVVGVDVGHNQLAPSLRGRDDVYCFEGVNARELPAEPLLTLAPGGFDWILMDVSFISQTLILSQLTGLIRPGGNLLSLVKPQFEVGPEGLNKQGLVKSNALLAQCKDKVIACAQRHGFTVGDYFDSGVLGGDGNREYFMFCRWQPTCSGSGS